MDIHNRKNIKWINYVKALCMIGIYYMHCNTQYHYPIQYVGSVISPWMTSSFFFISGYLLFKKQLSEPLIGQSRKEYIKDGGRKLFLNILFRIAIPSAVFAAIEFFPSYLLRGYDITLGELLFKTVGGGTYWFNSALVTAELIMLVLLLLRVKNIFFYLGCSVISFGIGFYLCENANIGDLPQYWSWQQSMFAVFFLAVGGVYQKAETAITEFLDKKNNKALPVVRKWVVPVVFATAYGILIYLYGENSRTTISVLNIDGKGACVMLIGTIALIGICKWFGNNRLFDFIGKNTMGFYVMSGALPYVCGVVVNKVLPKSLLGFLLAWLGAMVIAGVAILFMNRFIPFIFDFRLLRKKGDSHE